MFPTERETHGGEPLLEVVCLLTVEAQKQPGRVPCPGRKWVVECPVQDEWLSTVCRKEKSRVPYPKRKGSSGMPWNQRGSSGMPKKQRGRPQVSSQRKQTTKCSACWTWRRACLHRTTPPNLSCLPPQGWGQGGPDRNLAGATEPRLGCQSGVYCSRERGLKPLRPDIFTRCRNSILSPGQHLLALPAP